MSKKVVELRTNKIGVLQEKLDSFFTPIGPNDPQANHRQISKLYVKQFNAIDLYNKYVFSLFFTFPIL
jgi:hypothetical protein